MNPERWDAIGRLFRVALELGPDERRAYLDRECGSDLVLEREVRALLAEAGAAEDLVHEIAARSAFELLARDHPDDMPGKRIGVYRIDRRIGRGGMGTVYLAHRDDRQFDKTVAIKFTCCSPGSAERRRAFRRELQHLARLEHANIARLIDGGITPERQAYLVMEYIDGMPLGEFANERNVSVAGRLRLFKQVCAAAQYAHRQLIVHRDLKPGNILVTADGVVKLLDFGISKMLDTGAAGSAETTIGARCMTPQYASPEQLSGEPISTTSDVYSLGVILYELLSGQLPYTFDNLRHAEVLRVLGSTPPRRPSERCVRETPVGDGSRIGRRRHRESPEKLQQLLRGDLDTITLKALAFDPAERYAAVENLVEDLDRHLRGEPILAHAPSLLYHLKKLICRHKIIFALNALLYILLGGFGCWMFMQSRCNDSLMRQMTMQSGDRAGLHLTLGDAYRQQGRWDDAYAQYQSALSIRRALGRPAGELAEILRRLGMLSFQAGDYAQAEMWFSDGLQLLYPETAILEYADLSNRLGLTLVLLGQYDRAGSRLLLAHKLRRRLGATHPEVLASENNLGLLCHERGDWHEADAHYRAVLRVEDGLSPAAASRTMINLAALRIDQQNYDEAEKLLQEALQMLRSEFGERHPDVAAALQGLARIQMARGCFEVAEVSFQEAIEIRQGSLPAQHWLIAQSKTELGECLRHQMRYAEAEPLLINGLPVLREALGQDHKRVQAALSRIVALYDHWGKPERADEFRQWLEPHTPVGGLTSRVENWIQ